MEKIMSIFQPIPVLKIEKIIKEGKKIYKIRVLIPVVAK